MTKQFDWRLPVSFQGGGRDWDWHASHVEPDGRILMPLDLLHPSDGHVADARGYADITALCGTVVRMKRNGLLRLLHVNLTGWERFQRWHCVPRTEDGGVTYFHFDPATRMSDIYDEWERDLGEPTSMSEFALAKQFYRYANPPANRLPPPAVISAAARTLTRNPSSGEHLRQFMSVRQHLQTEILEAVRVQRADIAASRSTPRSYAPVTEEEMNERVSFLAELSNSCFEADEDDAERFPGPDATSRARLNRIVVGFVPAAFFTYSKAPVMRSPEMLPRYLRSFDRFVTEAAAENPRFDIAKRADLERAFEHVAFGDLIVFQCSRGWRDRMVQDAAGFMRHARSAMVAFDPLGAKGILEQAPAEQNDRKGFLQRVKAAYAKDREEYGASRTKFANRVKNAYERVIDAAANRVQQIKEDGAAGRHAIDYLLSAAGSDLPYWDGYIEGPELSETGHPTGRLQLRRYRWWRIDDAWVSLQHDRDWSMEAAPDVWRAHQAMTTNRAIRIKMPTQADMDRRPPFHGSQFVCEFLSATLVGQPETPSNSPLLAVLAKHHAFLGGGFLDVGQRELKEKLRRRWRIPTNGAERRGLLQFDSERARLARRASRSDRRHPRIIVPHEEAEHALRLAAHGVDAIVQTWCRTSEFIQQDEYGDHWLDPAGTGAFGWIASRKLSRRDPVGTEHFLECDENHYLESVELLNLTCRRCGLERPAIVAPLRQLAWKLGPAPYVYAFDDRFVPKRGLADYLRFLLVNVVDARFHDLRAGASNRSRRSGAAHGVLGVGLGHRSDACIELYSSLTPEQSLVSDVEIRITKIDRIEEAKNRRNQQ